ncbi:nucleotidyltransferase domain-containing protein [Spirosoma sp. HMF3257]|uniref:Nucleotidyltransferase domain-containing protein n=1 Tax=Spirosoma telluris TaxID=2183553 RepID=A0A327NN99_9BACT|nr:nucleotidyltransferase domain-containing protein [Spirosoma telluris]RAI75314.1 nucleotidyltransferase domain-containing protein [Spirosoma telluris]
MIHPFLANQLPAVTRILKENGVKRAYAFGSVCTDQFTETSDVDLLIGFDANLDPVSYGENYFTIAHALESVLNRPVDLVTERSVKNPYFLARLEQTKTTIYE